MLAGNPIQALRAVFVIPADHNCVVLTVCMLAQASGLVPIVEPEVLLDGEHDIDATLEVAQAIWAETFKYLADNNVRALAHAGWILSCAA